MDFVAVITPVKAVDNAALPHELEKNHQCMSKIVRVCAPAKNKCHNSKFGPAVIGDD